MLCELGDGYTNSERKVSFCVLGFTFSLAEHYETSLFMFKLDSLASLRELGVAKGKFKCEQVICYCVEV